MTIYLESYYRLWLFCRAYVKSGESLGSLARDLGYKGQGGNGKVRDLWLGRGGIPDGKFLSLCQVAGVSDYEARTHEIERKKSSPSKDWIPIIQLYKKYTNPKPEIFLKSRILQVDTTHKG